MYGWTAHQTLHVLGERDSTLLCVEAARCVQDVGKRILGAIIFRQSLFDEIEQHPDLYGPFWLSTTAIFMMAMISNALDFFAYNDSEVAWEGDLQKIASGAFLLNE
jgi:hypothetical protein